MDIFTRSINKYFHFTFSLIYFVWESGVWWCFGHSQVMSNKQTAVIDQCSFHLQSVMELGRNVSV